LGTHGLWQKYEPYEECLRVPLIFSAPWFSHGTQSHATVSLLDIMPTLLSLAGAKAPPVLEGRDLSSLLTGTDSSAFQDRYVFSEHTPLGSFHKTVDWCMVTDNTWKYVWNCGDLDELFHLELDPYEILNLIDLPEHAAEQRRLQAAMMSHMETTDHPLAPLFSKETQLEHYGDNHG
jgi:arylsulfatase A-like enzyme